MAKRCKKCGRRTKKHWAFVGIDGKRYTVRKGRVVRAC
jgi:hypothetical protein